MLAFALRKTGWYLQHDIIWNKPNQMPESVRDRCTKAHEYVFLFAKSPKYYFNQILEPACYDGRKARKHSVSAKYLNNSSGLATQSISKGGAERWANRIESIPARNRLVCGQYRQKALKGRILPPSLLT